MSTSGSAVRSQSIGCEMRQTKRKGGVVSTRGLSAPRFCGSASVLRTEVAAVSRAMTGGRSDTGAKQSSFNAEGSAAGGRISSIAPAKTLPIKSIEDRIFQIVKLR